jgi:cation transport ATPase
MSEAALCMHCSQPVGASAISGFCCAGCQAVYRILSSGPFSDYYRIRREGVCFEKPAPVDLRIRDYSFWNQNREDVIQVFIEGVHCTACVWLLERLPLALPGEVLGSRLDLSRSQLTLDLASGADRARIAKTIESFGYLPHLIGSRSEGEALLEQENRKRLIDVGIAGALAGNVMLMSIPLYSGVEGGFQALFEWFSFALAVPAVFYSGRSFFSNVSTGVRNRIFPIDGPILLAILTAFFYSTASLLRGTHDLYFDSLTALVFLLLSSRYYLSRVRQSSGLNPGVIGFFHAPFSGATGDVVSLRAGDAVAFDGKILRGRIWVDSSHFTGEADPVQLHPGDLIHAGCRVVEVEPDVEVRVEQAGADTRLQKFLGRIEQARMKRTSLEQATERWARSLLIFMLGLAGVSFAFFVHAGIPQEGLRRVLALLIVTCPCALALATPLVYSLAAGGLLKRGILLKNPEALDRILAAREIFFDKTGTLTTGELRIRPVDLSTLGPGDRAVLAALTSRSNHPVSRAIYREVSGSIGTTALPDLREWREVPGIGVEAREQGQEGEALYGLRRHPSGTEYGVQFYRDSGAGPEQIAVIHFEDRIRPDSAESAERLKKMGFSLHLLTGDHERNANAVARDLPMSISARMTPEQKGERAAAGIMVGDGVNDSLALLKARVGIAVQGGMEAAIQSADVYGLRPGISGVPVLIDTARRVRGVLLSNFAISTAYNLLGAVLALKGWMNPLIAAVVMPVSATTVFANSMMRMREPKA